jgi:hypothetical protein
MFLPSKALTVVEMMNTVSPLFSDYSELTPISTALPVTVLQELPSQLLITLSLSTVQVLRGPTVSLVTMPPFSYQALDVVSYLNDFIVDLSSFQ